MKNSKKRKSVHRQWRHSVPFPLRDVQSLIFTPTNDTVTLTSGKVYCGRIYGSRPSVVQRQPGH
jgi:hypothetical protein